MFCGKCGKELISGAKFCQYCGSTQDLQENQVDLPAKTEVASYIETNNNIEKPVDNHQANVLCTISLLLYFVLPIFSIVIAYIMAVFKEDMSPVVSLVFNLMLSVSSMGRLAAYVLMIIARVKYPTSKYAKVVMWIYIILLVIELIVAAILIIACGFAIGSCIGGLKGLSYDG